MRPAIYLSTKKGTWNPFDNTLASGRLADWKVVFLRGGFGGKWKVQTYWPISTKYETWKFWQEMAKKATDPLLPGVMPWRKKGHVMTTIYHPTWVHKDLERLLGPPAFFSGLVDMLYQKGLYTACSLFILAISCRTGRDLTSIGPAISEGFLEHI